MRKPDRDFIPLEEIEVLCGVSPEECEELLLVTIAVEDEGPKTGILVHAEGPNCPPNCYRIAETKRFKFVSSWELGREDQDIAPGMTAAISRRGVADLRELGAVSSADKLLSEPRYDVGKNPLTFAKAGVFRGVQHMKMFLEQSKAVAGRANSEAEQPEAVARGVAPSIMGADAAAAATTADEFDEPVEAKAFDATNFGMTFGFGRVANQHREED